jgi:hypothetical protein
VQAVTISGMAKAVTDEVEALTYCRRRAMSRPIPTEIERGMDA